MSISRRHQEAGALSGQNRISCHPLGRNSPSECTPRGVSWSHPPANAPRIERNFRDLSCLAIAFGEETLWQESNCAFVAWYPASTGRRNGTITFSRLQPAHLLQRRPGSLRSASPGKARRRKGTLGDPTFMPLRINFCVVVCDSYGVQQDSSFHQLFV